MITERCVLLACFDTQVWKERHPRFCVYRCADDGKLREHPEIKLYQVNYSHETSIILHKNMYFDVCIKGARHL